MLCNLCQGLSISQLVKLAETELSGHDFPQQAFYQHHSSYEKLKCAAQNGCELCQLLLLGFENIAVREGYWEGETRSSAVEDLESSDIKICINSEHIYSGDRIENVRMLDILMVQCGVPINSRSSNSEEEYMKISPLRLALKVRRGMFYSFQYHIELIDPLKKNQKASGSIKLGVISLILTLNRTSICALQGIGSTNVIKGTPPVRRNRFQCYLAE